MAVKDSPKNPREIRWQPHKHCPVCSNAMALNNEYCSNNCEKLIVEYKEKQKKKNKRIYMFLLPVLFVVVLFLLLQTAP